MAIYGKTWWGQKWLETFTGIDHDNRLVRGRSYANTGRAHDIKIEGNIITAKVMGSRPRPYKVTVIIPAFSQTQQEIIRVAISNSTATLSALMNLSLPPRLLSILTGRGIHLFPSKWKDINAECNCPDWAMPCKHIAAVIYLICAEIDKNPFIVFDIHNCDILSLVGDFSDGKLKDAKKIINTADIVKSNESVKTIFAQEVLDSIDLSKIQNLSNHTIGILRNDPPFYDRNLRDLLAAAYQHWSRYPKGNKDYSWQSYQISKGKKDVSEDELFCLKWHNPEQWSSFNLVVDDNLQLLKIVDGNNEPLIYLGQSLLFNLVKFLEEIPNSILHKLCPELNFIHMLSQLSIKLMEKSAIIPQILQNKHKYLVRWIPALFDDEVKLIYNKLCSMAPQNLVRYQASSLSAGESVNTVIALILSGYIYNNLPAKYDREEKYDVFQLFFMQKPCAFIEFSNKELPNAINSWLSPLFLHKRQHKLFLNIDDNGIDFGVDIKVSLDDNKTPLSLSKALASNDKARLAILSDLSLLLEYIPALEEAIDDNKIITFNLDDFAPLFTGILPVLKAIGVIIILPKSLQKIFKPSLSLALKSKTKIDDDRKSFLNLENLLEFDWQIAIGNRKLSIAEFRKMLKESRGLVRMFDQYVMLDDKEMQLLLKQLEKLPNYLSQADLMQSALSGEFFGASVDIDLHLSSLLKKLESYDKVSTPHNLNASLRPYQERGFNWLVQNITMGFGSILADDMGLGKTLQVITAILHLKNTGMLGSENRVLVIAPTSLLSNWHKEVEKFAPSLNLMIYHGQNRELNQEYDILITSYGLARRDVKELNKMKWALLAIDEAQNIKNPNTDQSKAIKSIKANHKIAMSGTPVENRLLEYWSIFDFTNKHYLGTPKQFKDRYASLIEKERDKDCLERFKKVTSPFILRRLKSDKSIIQDLPDKIENNRYCSLTKEQAAIYQEIVDLSMKKIDNSEGIERKGLVLKLINSLKQICNHPAHFGKKSKAAIDQSGKMESLEEILLEVEQTAEKAIIFTQYTEMGEIIAKLFAEKFNAQIPFLHGGLSLKARDAMVHDFQNLSNVRTLIVSLKAGGTGLNLTAASHVIHYDLWWNPAVEAQATDRAYRIGQKRNVMVHRLITTGTFEEKIDEMIQSKKELANLAVGSGESWITEMSTEQLKDLVSLRAGA